MLDGMVPKTQETAPMIEQPAPQIDYYSEDVTSVTDEFFKQRTKNHGNYRELEQGYYALPNNQRSSYLLKNPELKEYWDWKGQWFDSYPELEPILRGQVFKTIDTSTWAPGLVEYATTYAYTGKKLPTGAYKSLEQVWIMEGRPMDDMQTWLDSQIVPALLYGEGQQ